MLVTLFHYEWHSFLHQRSTDCAEDSRFLKIHNLAGDKPFRTSALNYISIWQSVIAYDFT